MEWSVAIFAGIGGPVKIAVIAVAVVARQPLLGAPLIDAVGDEGDVGGAPGMPVTSVSRGALATVERPAAVYLDPPRPT